MVMLRHFEQQVPGVAAGGRISRQDYGPASRAVQERLTRAAVPQSIWSQWGWMFDDEEHSRLSDEYILRQRSAALVNFDLSMLYFSTLEPRGLEEALARVLAVGDFEQIHDLSRLQGRRGCYVLVFDSHRQLYVGQGLDMAASIRGHWEGRAGFERLLWGSEFESVLPVDEFGALDNTRIYACATAERLGVERAAIRAAHLGYCLNRTPGGELGGAPLRDRPGSSRAGRLWHRAPRISEEERDRLHARVLATVLDPGAPLDRLEGVLSGFAGGVYRCTDSRGRSRPWSPVSTVAGLEGAGIGRRLEALAVLGQDIALPS